MSSSFSCLILQKSAVVVIEGEKFIIPASDYRYKQLTDFAMDDDIEGIKKLLSEASVTHEIAPEIVINPDDTITSNGVELPSEIATTVKKHREQNLSDAALKAFKDRLLKNPSESARKMLFNFLKHNNHPIADDGRFVAYKKINRNFRDIRTNTIDNSPGKIVTMNRDEVVENPAFTCSAGLHVGSWSYFGCFGDPDHPIVLVMVDPADVVSVPVDYDGTKMRVCRYEVIKQVTEPTDKPPAEVQSSQQPVENSTKGKVKTPNDVKSAKSSTKHNILNAVITVIPRPETVETENKWASFPVSVFGHAVDPNFDWESCADFEMEIQVGHIRRKVVATVRRHGTKLRFAWDKNYGPLVLARNGESTRITIKTIVPR